MSAAPDPGRDAARAFLDAVMRPRRRARPRVAEPLREAEAREVETPHGKIAAWRLGVGPAVLLVHGWEDDNALWTRLIDALAARGRAVVVFDLPAHGFSEGDVCSPPVAAEAVRQVAAALGPIEAVCGHSFGCPASVLAMEAGLAVERIALIATPLGRRARWDRAAEAMGIGEDVVARAKALYEAQWPEAARFDLSEAAARMSARALFVHSADDEQVSFAGARSAAAAWPGAEFLLVDGLGHRLVAQDPDIVARVADFLDTP